MIRIAAAVAAVLALAVTALYLLQDRLIFPATRHVAQTPKDAHGLDYEEHHLPVLDHTTHAWFIPAPNARGAVIFSHGNGGTVGQWVVPAREFYDLGLDVLLYDYGGYGYSTGSPSETRLCADIRAAWRFLTENKGIAPNRIVLYGISMGGGVSCDLAAQHPPAAVILQSTYLSIPHVAADTMGPLGLLAPLIRHRFENYKKLPTIKCPVFITHSVEDDLIPFAQGQRLYELAPQPKTFLEGIGRHNAGHSRYQTAWIEAVDAFLTKILGPYAPPKPQQAQRRTKTAASTHAA